MSTVYWLHQGQSDVPRGDDWLSRSERQMAAGLHSEKRWCDWRLGRWTAKRTVALSQPDLPTGDPSAIEIRSANDGAPEAWWQEHLLQVTLSLSHREGEALCALAPKGVLLGCDLELIEPRIPSFLDTFFTEEEMSRLRGRPPVELELLANLYWSAKESALKALRLGLAADTRRVVVNADTSDISGTSWAPLEVRDTGTGRTFQGAWRRFGRMVLTVTSAPAPGDLLRLEAQV